MSVYKSACLPLTSVQFQRSAHPFVHTSVLGVLLTRGVFEGEICGDRPSALFESSPSGARVVAPVVPDDCVIAFLHALFDNLKSCFFSFFLFAF